MKDHVKIDHLTKYDAFRMNRAQAMNLEIWKSIQTSLILRRDPQKPYTVSPRYIIAAKFVVMICRSELLFNDLS